MGLATYDHYEPNSTPKLTLSKLPCKPREPIQMLTPPLHPSLAIPFHWEEAPGKPRAATDEAAPPPSSVAGTTPPPKVARCLDLPPRLLNDDTKMTIMPSPTTVLDGPYVGRSLSLACTFSFGKGVVAGREDGLRSKKKSSGKLGSWRWGSFREEGKFDGKGTFDFSSTLDDFFESEKNVKITRVRRKRSFFSLSGINSNLWADMYSSFKQVVSWKRSASR